jgi:glycerol kinase
MASYLGALDQGTTSTRFILFDRGGSVVGVAQREHRQIYPQPGWVEHDPVEIWRNSSNVMEEALRSSGLQASDLAAIGITNQRETTVVWEKSSGQPVYNALVWQDTRVANEVSRLSAEGGQDRFRGKTGLPLSTYFSALKVAWILDNVSGARDRAERGELLFGNMDAYLLWHLTGGSRGGRHMTEITNASRTQLMDLDTLQWDDDLLRAFNIPHAVLPSIGPSGRHFGEVVGGSLAGVPICGVLGDQHAALVGQTCFRAGQAKNTYGTGCFLLMNTGSRRVQSTAGLLTTPAYQFGDEPAVFALEGSIAIAGALVQWLRDNLGIIRQSPEIEELARSVEDNGGVYIVPAFSGLYAPYWKDSARGVVTGLTRYANKGHLARAVLEAVAFQTRDVVEAMERDCGIPVDQLRTDGGMVVNDLLMQTQADVLDRAVMRPRMLETTALGAAYAAGLTVGFYKDIDDLRANWSVERTWQPRQDPAEREARYRQWKKAVERSFDWVD